MKICSAHVISKVWEAMMASAFIYIFLYTVAFFITSSESTLAEAMPKLFFIFILMLVWDIFRNFAHRSAEVIIYSDRVGVYQEKQFLFQAEEFEFEFKDVSRVVLKVGYRFHDYAIIWLKDGRKLMIDQQYPKRQMYFVFGSVNLLEALARGYNAFNDRNNITSRAEVKTKANYSRGALSTIVDIFRMLR